MSPSFINQLIALDCFYLWSILNNTAMNIHVLVEYIPKDGETGSYRNDISPSKPCFSQWCYHFTFPPTIYEGTNFSISSLIRALLPFFLKL
jgi:hypothetical protein